jgi:hypothetical protein
MLGIGIWSRGFEDDKGVSQYRAHGKEQAFVIGES